MAAVSPSPLAPAAPAVSLRGVTKSYAIWDDSSTARLTALLRRLRGRAAGPGPEERFTAVQAVDLDVAPGECLGIIGRNGAGKSTLLQMIAGTLQPTSGTLRVNGRVAALLELGSGFNPDFTGRENIHLNAAILGLSREQIAAKYDAIVAYSGIGEFIDRPVRTYSSGMAVRLAFAVCVHVDADILIIDEALAVGDARFQFKCHATLDRMLQEGRTIIFVSHDTNAVKRLCDRAVLLERGELLFSGSPNDATNLYTKLITSPHGLEAIRGDLEELRSGAGRREPAGTPAGASRTPFPAENTQASELLDQTVGGAAAGHRLLAEERAHQQVSDREYAYGGDRGRITDIRLQDDRGQDRLSFVAGAAVRIRLRCEAAADIPDPIYAVTLKDVRGQEIFGTNTYFQNLTPPPVPAGTAAEAEFDLRLNVLPGVYFLSAGWVRIVNGEVEVIHRRYDAVRFDVLPRDRSFGIAWCPTTIRVRPAAPDPTPRP